MTPTGRALLLLPILLAAPVAAQAQDLEQVRAALDKYRDPIVAIHDG